MKLRNMKSIIASLKNNVIVSFAVPIILVLFLSCSDLTNSKVSASSSDENITVSGKFSVGSALPSEIAESLSTSEVVGKNSRSATSSFASDSELLVRAYPLNEVSSGDAAAPTLEPDFSKEFLGVADQTENTWNVKLNAAGNWYIEISLWHSVETGGKTCVLKGTTQVSLEKMGFNKIVEATPIVLEPICVLDVPGAINLEISNAIEDIQTLSYEWTALTSITYPEGKTLGDILPNGSNEFSEGKVTIEASSVPFGVYELAVSFKNATGNTLYSCVEAIPVFSGFTTDTWYGSSPYFIIRENSDGSQISEFLLTENALKSYATAPEMISVDDYPIILYDKNYSKLTYEFEDPTPGFNVFTSISGGEKIGDGIPFAEGKKVYDFVIDGEDTMSRTQPVYTVEEDVKGRPLRIVAYPSYAGFAYGKTLVSSIVDPTEYPDFSIKSIYATNGNVYAFVEGLSSYKIMSVDPEGTVKELFDSTDNAEVLGDINSPKIAVNGSYMYIVYWVSEDSTNTFYCKKFSFDAVSFTEVASISETCQNLFGEPYAYLTPTELFFDSYSDDPKLHVLVKYREGGDSSPSYGGILTVSEIEEEGEQKLVFTKVEDLKTSLGVSSEANGTSITYIYGWNSSGVDDNSVSFFGPQKIIAKKPDELVIADEGHYKVNSDIKNKNRVVKLNLKTLAMTAVDVKVGFDTYGYNGNGCNFLAEY